MNSNSDPDLRDKRRHEALEALHGRRGLQAPDAGHGPRSGQGAGSSRSALAVRLLARFPAWILACLACAAAQDQAGPRKPNIVVILADDLGYGSVSWYGGDIPTPNIDSIAASGVGFTSGYMTAPVCNPSRPALMTGRYQQRWGKELNSQTEGPVGAPRKSLPQRETTIATALKRAGYATGAVGKWQLGMDDGYHPLDRGFDSFLGMPSGSRFVDPDWPDARIAPGHEDSGDPDSTGRHRGLVQGRKRVPMNEYLTDRLGGEGVSFIGRNRDRPFFLYLAFHAPHGPIQTIDRYYRRFPGIANETQRIYAAMISALDDWVGAVLAELRRHGLEDRTLVIFTSDNGAAKPSDIDGRRNFPLIGHKRNLYEGGIRVPYVLQWKGRVPGGARYGHAVSSLDIFPTALDAAGADAGKYGPDGVSLLPHLLGERDGPPHASLVWRSGPNAAVRRGPWKLLVSGSGPARLYDVQEDPGESRDRSGDRPDLVRDLRRILDDWAKDKAEPRQGARRVKTRLNGDVMEWHI